VSIEVAIVNISVVILTKNEAANVRRCLEALAGFGDVVVVDSGSTDDTCQIAERLGARVLKNHFESFASQRNWALERAELKHPWALMLDADEVVTPEFCRQLDSRVREAKDETAGFMICRKTIFLDRWLRHSDGFPVWITRVVRRGTARFIDVGHGEKAVPVAGHTFGKIEQPILHYSFSKGISEWVDRHNRYSSQEAREELNAANAAPTRWRGLFSADAFCRRQTLLAVRRQLPGRPLWRFLYQYLWRRGILEGRAGLAYCLLMSFFETLIVIKRRELTLNADLVASVPANSDQPAPSALVSDDAGRAR
jgi:glycosyltransferase involved in cell wall biosynthesis